MIFRKRNCELNDLGVLSLSRLFISIDFIALMSDVILVPKTFLPNLFYVLNRVGFALFGFEKIDTFCSLTL